MEVLQLPPSALAICREVDAPKPQNRIDSTFRGEGGRGEGGGVGSAKLCGDFVSTNK